MHVRPAGLVLLVERVAKCLARQVEGTEEEVGLLRFQQVEQVPGKTKDGIDRLAAGAGHVRNGVEDLVDQGVGVDHPDRLSGQACRRRGRRFGGCRIGLQPVAANAVVRRRWCFRDGRLGFLRRHLLVEERFLTFGSEFSHRKVFHYYPNMECYPRERTPSRHALRRTEFIPFASKRQGNGINSVLRSLMSLTPCVNPHQFGPDSHVPKFFLALFPFPVQ